MTVVLNTQRYNISVLAIKEYLMHICYFESHVCLFFDYACNEGNVLPKKINPAFKNMCCFDVQQKTILAKLRLGWSSRKQNQIKLDIFESIEFPFCGADGW